MGTQFGRMAEEAWKQKYSGVRYLEALLAPEIEKREHNAVARRIFEAVKTLEKFDFSQAPHISAPRVQQLAEGPVRGRLQAEKTRPLHEGGGIGE
jgi:hypothetical protein